MQDHNGRYMAINDAFVEINENNMNIRNMIEIENDVWSIYSKSNLTNPRI